LCFLGQVFDRDTSPHPVGFREACVSLRPPFGPSACGWGLAVASGVSWCVMHGVLNTEFVNRGGVKGQGQLCVVGGHA
jgi:hypothetical protein